MLLNPKQKGLSSFFRENLTCNGLSLFKNVKSVLLVGRRSPYRGKLWRPPGSI